MLDELRDRVISFLSQNRLCVIATSGSFGAWAVLAEYDNTGLELDCLLPSWSDAIFHIEQESHVMTIIPDVHSVPLRWLQVRGTAQIGDSVNDRYVAVCIKPQRIDLVDESRGWGVCETLDV